MTPSILIPYFRKLEAVEGTGSCCIQFVPVEGKETGADARVEQIGARVTVLAPFSFKGNELTALGEFEHTAYNEEGWLINELDDVAPVLQEARMKAYIGALAMLDGDVRRLMKELRPSVSLKKQAKKSDGLLKRIGAEGLL